MLDEKGNEIPNISTGEPSTLETYLKIAKVVFGDKAEKWVQDKIKTAKNHENEVVIADEGQVMMMLARVQFGEGNNEIIAPTETNPQNS